jgi:hypothetical protein
MVPCNAIHAAFSFSNNVVGGGRAEGEHKEGKRMGRKNIERELNQNQGQGF